jgi:hypothetical protein
MIELPAVMKCDHKDKAECQESTPVQVILEEGYRGVQLKPQLPKGWSHRHDHTCCPQHEKLCDLL